MRKCYEVMTEERTLVMRKYYVVANSIEQAKDLVKPTDAEDEIITQTLPETIVRVREEE